MHSTCCCNSTQTQTARTTDTIPPESPHLLTLTPLPYTAALPKYTYDDDLF